MNTKRMKEALNTIAMGFAELSEAINEPGQGGGTAAGTTPALDSSPFEDELLPQPALADESVDFALEQQGSLTMCPKHRVAYLPSKHEGWAPYCPSKTDDAAWANQNGFCKINPRNAAQWLRMQAA